MITEKLPENISLEMSPELDALEITVTTKLGIGEVIIGQSKPEFYDGKWHIEIVLMKPGEQLSVIGGVKDEGGKDENGLKPAG